MGNHLLPHLVDRQCLELCFLAVEVVLPRVPNTLSYQLWILGHFGPFGAIWGAKTAVFRPDLLLSPSVETAATPVRELATDRSFLHELPQLAAAIFFLPCGADGVAFGAANECLQVIPRLLHTF